MRRVSCWACLSVMLATVVGCRSEQSRACETEFTRAQALVKEVTSTDAAALERSVAALDVAQKACSGAGRESESEQLLSARKRIADHLQRLKEREARQSTVKDPAAIERLVKNGDPECPSGQAYKHKASGQQVRCSGPQIADMAMEQARDYFSKRGYKVTTPRAERLHAEYGAERFELQYGKGRSGGPECLVLYPAPGPSWQESVARVTGTDPARMKPGGAVKAANGSLALNLEETPQKLIIRLGRCDG